MNAMDETTRDIQKNLQSTCRSHVYANFDLYVEGLEVNKAHNILFWKETKYSGLHICTRHIHVVNMLSCSCAWHKPCSSYSMRYSLHMNVKVCASYIHRLPNADHPC